MRRASLTSVIVNIEVPVFAAIFRIVTLKLSSTLRNAVVLHQRLA